MPHVAAASIGRLLGRLILIALILLGFTLALCGAVIVYLLWPRPLVPPTPPLLQHVRSAGGWMSGGCPHLPNDKFAFVPEALSLDLMARLAISHPPDSDADRLEAALLGQGLRMAEPCRNDPSIRRAIFTQSGGGFFGPYPMHATIAWRRSPRGRVEWTKAFVAYTGP